MQMKQKAGGRQQQKMSRRTMLLIATSSILGIIAVVFVVLNFSAISNMFAAGNTFYSRANGNWESSSTWSTSGYGGSPSSGYPSEGDIVYIDGHTVSIAGANAAAGQVKLEQ